MNRSFLMEVPGIGVYKETASSAFAAYLYGILPVYLLVPLAVKISVGVA